MTYIIIGALTAILGFLILWCWFKYIGPFTPLFEVGFILAVFVFGYSVMFFCIGLFGNKQNKNADVNECAIENTITEDTVTEDTSTYILLKIDTIYHGRNVILKV